MFVKGRMIYSFQYIYIFSILIYKIYMDQRKLVEFLKRKQEKREVVMIKKKKNKKKKKKDNSYNNIK